MKAYKRYRRKMWTSCGQAVGFGLILLAALLAERRRQYYEANKAKLADYQRQYYEANKECASDGKCAIKLCRLGLGLSQKEFARLVGVMQSAVSRWENVKAPADWEKIIEMVRKLHPEGAAVPQKGVKWRND